MGDHENILPEDLRRELDRIGGCDVLVGIPTFNSARTVGNVVTAVEAGLRKFFPDLSAMILISDGGSADASVAEALRAGCGDDAERFLVDPSSRPPEKVAFRYGGIPGKGSAFRGIFESAVRLGAKHCAVLDSDLRSIAPFWVDRLLSPVVRFGYDFVAPVYARHRFDGTITNSIAYPLTTALYGQRLRQPIGGEFGFSGGLAEHYVGRGVWETDVARFGIDIWMTTVAIVEGFRACQANLGAKLHDPKDPGSDLGPMLRQVVGSLFALAGKYPDRWMNVDEVRDPPTFGFPSVSEAEPIKVSVSRLMWKFVEGYVRFHDLWGEILSEETWTRLGNVIREAADSSSGLVVAPDLWFRILYDFMVAYNARSEEAGDLLDALIPLYFARTATFVQEVADDDNAEADRKVHALVDVAMAEKPYLRERWVEAEIPALRLAEQPVPDHGLPVEGVPEQLTSEPV